MANIYFQVFEMYGKHYKREYGEEFYPQKHHFKQCKDFLDVQEGFKPIPLDEVERRLPIFFADPFWRGCKHNITKFFEHFHRFIPERARHKAPPTIRRELRVFCSECDTEHNAHELCPKCYPVVEGDKETAIKAIEKLTNQWGMK